MMLKPFLELFSKRELVYLTTLTLMRAKYASSILGMFWVALYPLFFLCAYGGVFAFILKVRIGQQTPLEYIVMLFIGLLPFISFTEMLGTSVSAMASNRNLIRSSFFPIEIIPVQTVLLSMISMVIGIIILFSVLPFIYTVSFFSFLIIPALILQFLMFCGFSWILSAIAVGFRDIQHMISIISLLLMICSPIGYAKEMIPGRLIYVMYFNPLYHMIETYRGILLFNHLPYFEAIMFLLISLFVFWIGYSFFIKMKKSIFEYV